MIRKEQLYEQILEQIDLTKETDDEELQELIRTVLDEAADEEYIPLSDKIRIGRELFNSFRKLDVLQELLEDDSITEIMVNGIDHIFYEKEGRIFRSKKCFLSQERLLDVIQQIVGESNRYVNEASPIVDARLKDGSRVNVVLNPVAVNGPILTIRKFPSEAITMEQLICIGSVTDEAANFLKKLVAAKYNIFVSGGTGAGKTTFLNALSNYIPKGERLITIEDNAELQIQGVQNLVRLEARGPNAEGEGAVTIRDLIKSALRMRPDRIVVGEVRGEETVDMISSAMLNGHSGSMSTGHANNPTDMLHRLETMMLMGIDLPLQAIQRQVASALDIIIHLGRLRDKTRKVLQIVEVEGYEDGRIQTKVLYEFKEEGMKNGKIQGCLMKKNEITNKEKLLLQDITPSEYTVGIIKCTVRFLLILYLFYESILPAILLFPLWFLYMKEWMEEKAIGKEQEFRRQFRDSIQTMAGALKAGYSVENAIRETNRDLIGMYDANTRIRKEYGQMVRKLDLNLSVVTVLNEFAAEVKQEDVTNFITVYAAAKVSGGDSIAIIRDAARTIGEKIDTEREIQTMLAAKKLEFEIMSVIPFIMILYMKMTFGEFLSVLYGTWTGCIVMSICLVLYLGAYRFGRRLLQIEI